MNTFTWELGSCQFAYNQSKILHFFLQSVQCCEIHRKRPEGIRVIGPSLIKGAKNMQKRQTLDLRWVRKLPLTFPISEEKNPQN